MGGGDAGGADDIRRGHGVRRKTIPVSAAPVLGGRTEIKINDKLTFSIVF